MRTNVPNPRTPYWEYMRKAAMPATEPLVYVAGSLRNDRIPIIAQEIEERTGMKTFSDWFSAGPEADDHWKSYEQGMGRSYLEALNGPAATNVFEFDKRWIDRSTHMVLVLPAGKSGHLEIGYAAGQGKKTFILLEPDTDPRWDVMYRFVTAVAEDLADLCWKLKPTSGMTAVETYHALREGRL